MKQNAKSSLEDLIKFSEARIYLLIIMFSF